MFIFALQPDLNVGDGLADFDKRQDSQRLDYQRSRLDEKRA